MIVLSAHLGLSKYVLGGIIYFLKEDLPCEDAMHVGKIKQK